MPKSKRPTRASKNAKANRLSNIQIGGIVILVLVVAAIIYAVVTASSKAATAQASATATAAAAQAQTTPQANSNEPPKLVGTKTYSGPPPMTIDKTKQYFATFKMAKGGEFVIQLFPDKAPITVNSFVFLAKQGYYDGVTFHRVLKDFMAQGGDPTGTGSGGPGYEFVYEDSGLKFDKAGVVAMANTGPQTATNGSQFFITFGPQPSLDGGYTIFGQVTSGMDVVNGITKRNPQDNPPPTFTGDAIQSVTITEK